MADNQIFPKGSRVEVSIFEGALYVATVVDIIQVTPTKNTKKTPTKNTKKTPGKRLSKNTKNGMGYLVEYDPLLVRPVPPEDMVKNKEFSEGDIVDVLHKDGWWIGAIKKLVIDGEDEGKYLVGFENPTEELVFEKEKLRPHLDWVDSRWKVPPKNKKDGDPMFTYNFRKRSRGGEKSGASPGVKRKEAVQSGYQAMHQDSPIVEQQGNTAETTEGEESQIQPGTKKERPLPLEETRKTGDGQVVKSPNDFQEGSQAIMSIGGTNNEQPVWPFVKTNWFWDSTEYLNISKKQKPHFSPLEKMKKGLREGFAVGHMVAFEGVARNIVNYQPSDSIEKIKDSLEILDELEPHGFDVSALRGRLNTFLSTKVEVDEFKDELKKFENGIEKCNVEKRTARETIQKCDEMMADLEKESAELAEKRAKLEEKRNELEDKRLQNVKIVRLVYQDIKRLQSNVDLVANQLTEKELAVKKIAAMPL